jgi:hypothetical protein
MCAVNGDNQMRCLVCVTWVSLWPLASRAGVEMSLALTPKRMVRLAPKWHTGQLRGLMLRAHSRDYSRHRVCWLSTDGSTSCEKY